MKKSTLFASLSLLVMAGAVASCSEADPEYNNSETIMASEGNFAYDSDGVWDRNSSGSFLDIDDYEFSHIVQNTQWGDFIYGFTPSRVADTSLHSPLYTFPYASAAGGGISGEGSQYLVGYWGQDLEGENCSFNDRTCRIYEEDGDLFQPQSVMVCNNTYAMYEALNGSSFVSKAQAGDWVTLIAHGVHQDGTESTAAFYLINIETSVVKAGILTSWKEFDLSGLGTCTGVYFTMDCSRGWKTRNADGSTGSMLFPTYFCLDRLIVND